MSNSKAEHAIARGRAGCQRGSSLTFGKIHMPWYIPIVSAVLGILGGLYIRARFDQRAEKTARYLAVLKTYLELTDKEPELHLHETRMSAYRAWALLRAGALTLSERSFDQLLEDTRAYGRAAPKKEQAIQQLGLRTVLSMAACLERDLRAEALSVSAFKMIEEARRLSMKVETPQGLRVPDSLYPKA